VPYPLPLVRYGPADAPWSTKKHHPGVDAFGMTLDGSGLRVRAPCKRVPELAECEARR
jgi:hypothetical protein